LLSGGCWCTWFHRGVGEKKLTADGNRELKERLVAEGRAHAALVFDGELAVGWCQFGKTEELPNINHRKEYEKGVDQPPDFRVTCFFVATAYRRRGVSAAALRGALDLIAQAGGGVVEAYPQDTAAGRPPLPSSTTPPVASSRRPGCSIPARRARTTAL
jgi:ribosomal protein S18 acetylase RimI-like enzyme